jgi:uncharacterized membrane protein YfcA
MRTVLRTITGAVVALLGLFALVGYCYLVVNYPVVTVVLTVAAIGGWIGVVWQPKRSEKPRCGRF